MKIIKVAIRTLCLATLPAWLVTSDVSVAQSAPLSDLNVGMPPPVVSPSAPGGQPPNGQIGTHPLTGPSQTKGDVEWKAIEKRTDGYNRQGLLRGPWTIRLGGDRNYYVDRLPSEYVEREQRWESPERMRRRVRTFRKEFWAFTDNPQNELNIRAYKADMEVNARLRSQLIKEQTDLESDAGFERGKAPDRPIPSLREFSFNRELCRVKRPWAKRASRLITFGASRALP